MTATTITFYDHRRSRERKVPYDCLSQSHIIWPYSPMESYSPHGVFIPTTSVSCSQTRHPNPFFFLLVEILPSLGPHKPSWVYKMSFTAVNSSPSSNFLLWRDSHSKLELPGMLLCFRSSSLTFLGGHAVMNFHSCKQMSDQVGEHITHVST